MTVQHKWKTIKTSCQDFVNSDNDHLKKVIALGLKITVIMRNKFQDFDNQTVFKTKTNPLDWNWAEVLLVWSDLLPD